MPEAQPLPDLSRPSCGTFSPQLCRAVLEQVADAGAVLSLSVSSGREERVFFFTRGAILFLASGPLGRSLLETRVVAKGLLFQARVQELVEQAKTTGSTLQDLLVKAGGVPKEDVTRQIEEILEEHLVQIALWDGALYDLVPGNPPQKLYDRDAPALRLSTGASALLARVRPRIDRAAAALQVLGSLKNLVLPAKTQPRASLNLEPEAMALRALVGDEKKRIRDVVTAARETGLDAVDTVEHLVSLVTARMLAVEVDVVALTREQELAQAREIERVMDAFVNKLLADMHLARIYMKVDDKEGAARHLRAVAKEHLAHERHDEGLSALRDVVKQDARDLEARELIVKVLQNANRVAEAAKEAVELGRLFLQFGLPGRAKQAFELSLQLVPGTINVLWMLGGLLQKLGFKEDAVRVFEELTQRAKEQGDQAAAIAGSQQIVAIAPHNATATSILQATPGYARAKALRYSLFAVSGVVLAVTVGWGSFEMAALSAFRRAREAVESELAAHHFDEARAAARAYEASWHLSRHAAASSRLLELVETEEHVLHAQVASRESRLARALEEKDQLPQALEHWQKAQAQSPSDPALTKEIALGVARCNLRVEAANQALAEARHATERSLPEQAHEALGRALERAPWLRTPAMKIPLRIETFPKGAQATLDGQLLQDPTPLVLDRAYAPGTLRLEVRARDPITIPLEALPPWPVRVVLPRHPEWTFAALDPSGPPLAAGAGVLCAGRDHAVYSFAVTDGKLRWRTDLGLFGECDLPLARDADHVYARLDLGTVVALDLETGQELWRQEVVPLPFDALDPLGAAPVVVPGGVLVREDARSLVLLDAKTGARRWAIRLRADPKGVPVAAGERALLLLESGILPVRLADGTQLPVVVLPARALSEPVVLSTGAVAIPLEPDAVVFLEGTRLREPVRLTSGALSTPLAALGTTVWAGSNRGEALSFDPATQKLERFSAADGFEVRWVMPVDPKLILVGTEGAFQALDGRGQEVWREPAREGTVAADDTRVYVAGNGLAALDR